MPEVIVRPLGHADLASVVAIHQRAFPDSALTAFGDEAVRRYYAWLLDGPHDAVLAGAWDGDRLVGFCAAGVFRGAMNGFLRANRPYLIYRVATHPSLLFSELIRSRVRAALTITLRYSRIARRHTASSAGSAPPSFGVLSIATSPEARGRGAGRALMREAEERARLLGYGRMVLTVHPENVHAVRFYEELGWKRHASEGDAWSGAMHRVLSPAETVG